MVQSFFFRTKASAATGGTNNRTVPTSRTRNLLAPRSDFRMSPAAMPKRWDRRPASGTLTVHSEVQLKLDTTTTPRISGDLIVDAGQQRLGLAPHLEQQRHRRRMRPWSGQKTENCSRGPRGASASASGWLWKNSNGVVAGVAAGGADRFPDTRDIWSVSTKGPTTRDANCERTTRWTPPW